jgi:hypothetical protein
MTWLDAKRLASQARLCSMEWVSNSRSPIYKEYRRSFHRTVGSLWYFLPLSSVDTDSTFGTLLSDVPCLSLCQQWHLSRFLYNIFITTVPSLWPTQFLNPTSRSNGYRHDPYSKSQPAAQLSYFSFSFSSSASRSKDWDGVSH